MKAFLALKIRKSVLELTFAFGKFNILGLVNFDFFDLAKFTTVDRFLILLSTLLSSVPPTASSAS